MEWDGKDDDTYEDYLQRLQSIGYLIITRNDDGPSVEISKEAVEILRRINNNEDTSEFNSALVDFIQSIQKHERPTTVSWDWVEVEPDK